MKQQLKWPGWRSVEHSRSSRRQKNSRRVIVTLSGPAAALGRRFATASRSRSRISAASMVAGMSRSWRSMTNFNRMAR